MAPLLDAVAWQDVRLFGRPNLLAAWPAWFGYRCGIGFSPARRWSMGLDVVADVIYSSRAGRLFLRESTIKGECEPFTANGQDDCYGSWLRGNSETEFANRKFVPTSINLKNESAGDGRGDKTIEKTILRTFRARTFSRSQGR